MLGKPDLFCEFGLPRKTRSFDSSLPGVAFISVLACLWLLWPIDEAREQACNTTGTNQTCTNPAGTITGGNFGVSGYLDATLTNSSASDVFDVSRTPSGAGKRA
jgi:hypothetical protein